jgi:TonB family protein
MNSSTFTLLLLVGASIAVGQEAGPTVQRTAQPPAKVYEVGNDVIAPELVPLQWEVMAPDTCKQVRDGLVSLTLTVDAGGVPGDIAVANAQGTPVEKMALRIAGADRFKPGNLKGEPVAVKRAAQIDVEGCIDIKDDGEGNKSSVFRLTAQPVQKFGATIVPKEPAQIAIAIAAVPLEPGLYKVGNGVSPPVALNHVEARYSDEARRKKIQGICLVSVIVDAYGMPENPRVRKSLDPGLDQRAIEAVIKYRFKPAMKDGVPVPVMITVAVNFRLY